MGQSGSNSWILSLNELKGCWFHQWLPHIAHFIMNISSHPQGNITKLKKWHRLVHWTSDCASHLQLQYPIRNRRLISAKTVRSMTKLPTNNDQFTTGARPKPVFSSPLVPVSLWLSCDISPAKRCSASMHHALLIHCHWRMDEQRPR